MNRRDFLRRSALIAAGAVAADQLELIERLGWRRKFFAGWTPQPNTVGTKGLYRITSIESGFPVNGLSTITFGMGGAGRQGDVSFDAQWQPDISSRYKVGDWVHLSGSWIDD
jgi:hypothetical protein